MQPPTFNRAQLAHLASKFPAEDHQQPTDSIPSTHTFCIYVPPDSEDRVISYKKLLQLEQEKFRAQQQLTCPTDLTNDVPPAPSEVPVLTTDGLGNANSSQNEEANSIDGGDGSDNEEAPTTRTGNNDYYQLDDPFIDDSELNLDANVGLVRPKQDGFFVCYGPLETIPVANELLEQHRPKRRPKPPVVKGKPATRKSKSGKYQQADSDTDMEEKGDAEETAEKRQRKPRKKKSSEDATQDSNAVSKAKSSKSKSKTSAAETHENEDDVKEATALPKKAKTLSKKDKIKPLTTSSKPPSTTDVEMEDYSRERQIPGSHIVAEGSAEKPASLKRKKKIDTNDVVTASPSVSNPDILHKKAVKPRKWKSKKKDADTEAAAGEKSNAKATEDKTATTTAPTVPEVNSLIPADATASETSTQRNPLSFENTPARASENTAKVSSHYITPATTTEPVAPLKANLSPEVSGIVESLRAAAATEAFEDKTRFPARLRNIFLQAGRVHLEETGGILSDLLVNTLREILPYNRITVKKLLLRHLLPERQRHREQKHLQLLEEFKKILEDTLVPQMEKRNAPVNGEHEVLNIDASESQPPISAANLSQTEKAKLAEDRKFKFNYPLREKLYDVVKSALDICKAANELNELQKSPDRQTEHAARASIYGQLAALWPPGWITTSIISVQYSGVKHRKEGSAKKATGPKSNPVEGSPSKRKVKKETAQEEGGTETVARKRKPTTEDSETTGTLNETNQKKKSKSDGSPESGTTGDLVSAAVSAPHQQKILDDASIINIPSTQDTRDSPARKRCGSI